VREREGGREIEREGEREREREFEFTAFQLFNDTVKLL
jgi:hypothetical protein